MMNKNLFWMIFYTRKKNPTKSLHIFIIGVARTGKMYVLLMCIIQNMLQYYIKEITNVEQK
jgi:predicted AAA+ superfamily ATPase